MKDFLPLISQYTDFHYHELFIRELSNLLDDELSGHKREFVLMLTRQLRFIDTLRSRVNRADDNEILKHTQRRFYSIHLKQKFFNIRLIIFITADDSAVYFLSAFYERSGKRKTSYREYEPTLETRLHDLVEI